MAVGIKLTPALVWNLRTRRLNCLSLSDNSPPQQPAYQFYPYIHWRGPKWLGAFPGSSTAKTQPRWDGFHATRITGPTPDATFRHVDASPFVPRFKMKI